MARKVACGSLFFFIFKGVSGLGFTQSYVPSSAVVPFLVVKGREKRGGEWKGRE